MNESEEGIGREIENQKGGQKRQYQASGTWVVLKGGTLRYDKGAGRLGVLFSLMSNQ